MMGYYITINYRNGKVEANKYVDDYSIKDGCLMTYVRFGVNSGLRYIPLDLIENWKVER